MDADTDMPKKKRPPWKRWGWWGFVLINLAGLLLIIPLLRSVSPLLGIWWNTRSQASFRRYQNESAKSPPAPSPTARAADLKAIAATPSTDTNVGFQTLTNQTKVLENLTDQDLRQIVALKFGGKKPPGSDPKAFDKNSAVFDKITSSTLQVDDKTVYHYEIDLVDQNGNHAISLEDFAEPNLEYERGKAALELINNNSQLKRIYDAMAYMLAEKSSASTNPPANPATNEPAFRLKEATNEVNH